MRKKSNFLAALFLIFLDESFFRLKIKNHSRYMENDTPSPQILNVLR